MASADGAPFTCRLSRRGQFPVDKSNASSTFAWLEGIQTLAPDVAVLDMSMPGPTGLEILARIDMSAQRTRFVLLTASASDRQIVTALARGAMGIVHKDAVLRDLAHCIREAAKGRQWLSETMARRIASFRSRTPSVQGRQEQLTTREHEIMLLVSRGLSNKEAGRELDLSGGTVKIHLHNIYQKVSVANRTALAAMAITYQARLA